MHSLRFKVLALAAALILLTQAGTVSTVLVTASRDVSARSDAAFETGGRVVEQVSRSRAEQLGSMVRVLAADYAFKQAVASGDNATIQSALANHARRGSADLAMLLDANGAVLVTAGSAVHPDPGFRRLVEQSTADGIARTTLVAGQTAYDMLTVPIRAPLPIAWVAMGFAVTDPFATQIWNLSGLDTTFLARIDGKTRIVASSLSPHLRAALAGLLDSGVAGGARLQVGGTEFLARGQAFIPGSGDLSVLMMKSVDEAMAPYRLLRMAAVVLGGVPLVLALAGAVLLSRAVMRPVGKLVQAVRRINVGDYSKPVPVGSGDELSEFAMAFNAMQDGIAERERRIVFQLRYDALTGLPNRSFALEQLQATLTRAGDRPVTVVALGLSSVAEISASLGHDIGDEYLRHAAEQMRENLAGQHLLARLEGDEFLLVMEGAEVMEAQRTVLRLCEVLESGLAVGNVTLGVRPLAGLACFPAHGNQPDQLLRHAAAARNEAAHAIDRMRVYEAGGEERHARQLAILGDLRRAVYRDELQLYLQPKIELGSSRIAGAEALVRWNHPTLGFLQPVEFIPIAEQSGNISHITHWALNAAVRECRLWLEDGLDMAVAVNLSSQDLLNPRLPDQVRSLLRDHDLDARHLILEITEEALVRDFAHATLVLRYLRDLGVSIAIDDFGTGYSSLAQLKHLPVDELKIDRSFVMGLPETRADAAIVRATLDLARSLGLKVVAEGVETTAALAWLKTHGCNHAQGYLISRPMPAAEFQNWTRDYAGAASAATDVGIAAEAAPTGGNRAALPAGLAPRRTASGPSAA